MKRWIKSPQYDIGDVVVKGNAYGYQGTFDMIGDITNFPKELLEFVRTGWLHGYDKSGNPIYRIEFLTDEDHLFKENYERFFRKIDRILEQSGFKRLED